MCPNIDIKAEGDMSGKRLRSKEPEVKMSVPEGLEFGKPYSLEEKKEEKKEIIKLPQSLKESLREAIKHTSRKGVKDLPTDIDRFFED